MNKNKLIEKLEKMLEPAHDPNERGHRFTPDDEYPDFCKHCGWISYGDPLPCGHSKREHAEKFLRELKNGEVELEVIEIHIILGSEFHGFPFSKN